MMYREKSNHFDSDLDKILDRVYRERPTARSVIEINPALVYPGAVHREQGSVELKQALTELRRLREKSQSTLRLKEEVDYLQGQIEQLKTLGDQIATLRQQLGDEAR